MVVWSERLYIDWVTWPGDLLDPLTVRIENEKKPQKNRNLTWRLQWQPQKPQVWLLDPSHCITTLLEGHNRPSTPPKHNQVFPFHVQAPSEVRFIALIRSRLFLLRGLDFRTRSCEPEHISFGAPHSLLASFCNVVSWPSTFMFGGKKRPLVHGKSYPRHGFWWGMSR